MFPCPSLRRVQPEFRPPFTSAHFLLCHISRVNSRCAFTLYFEFRINFKPASERNLRKYRISNAVDIAAIPQGFQVARVSCLQKSLQRTAMVSSKFELQTSAETSIGDLAENLLRYAANSTCLLISWNSIRVENAVEMFHRCNYASFEQKSKIKQRKQDLCAAKYWHLRVPREPEKKVGERSRSTH